MHYRKDIQILRGLAVLFVVMFHLQVPGFRAGFLGVDIFFVISGYLMGVMYDPAKKFEFFAKRASRLLPAYFATILATLLAAAIVTRPDDFSKLASQAVFGALFASNIGFWMEDSYFDKSSFKPLLHLWSLSVEVQFYLLVPVISAFCRKYRGGLALIVLLSATLCFVAVMVAPGTAFYMLPFRLWEFLAGFGVAICLHGRAATGRGVWTTVSLAALLAILILPPLGPEGTAYGFLSGHPGLAALTAVLATATLLALGMPVWMQTNPVSGVLERLGACSYSVYLAHFPLIVLFLYRPFSGTVLRAPDAASAFTLLIMIVAGSAILFKLIEQPFRHQARALWFSAATAAATIATLPLVIHLQSSLFPANERLIYEAWFDRDEFRCGRFYSMIHRGDISCNLTPEMAPPSRRVLLVGNSHADAIKGTFRSVARARNTSVLFVVQNTPLMEGGRVGPHDLAREAREKKVGAVILHYSPGAVRIQAVEQLAQLLALHGIPVAYLLPIPVWQQSVPKMLIDNITGGVPLPVISAAASRKRNHEFEAAMMKIARPGFRVYRTDQVFCHPVCKMLGENGRPYYFDDAHLTTTGSEQLRPVFEQLFDELPR